MKYLITFLIVLYIPIVALSQEQEIKPFDPTQINTAVISCSCDSATIGI